MAVSRIEGGLQWRRQVRAGLVAAAIGFGLIDGCPLPPPDHTPAWEAGFVGPLRDLQEIAETPVAWIRRTVRVSQQWALYQAPQAKRWRMWIDGQLADRSWRILYRAADSEHAEDAALIEHARVWGSWNPTDSPPGEYSAFCGWITARMLAAHPELLLARVRMEPIAIGKGGFDSSGTFVWTYTRRRGAK